MCEFCKSLESYKHIRAFLDGQSGEKLFEEYKAALVIRTWTKGNKAKAGRTTDYRFKGIGYELNYCPECGRKLDAV